MTAKDIKPTDPDAEARDAEARGTKDDTEEARTTDRKTNAARPGR